jgi:hypothetical protein
MFSEVGGPVDVLGTSVHLSDCEPLSLHGLRLGMLAHVIQDRSHVVEDRGHRDMFIPISTSCDLQRALERF